MNKIAELKKIHKSKKEEIVSRLKEFEQIWRYGTEEDIFSELAFCIFTPQSRAKSCWNAILALKNQNLLLTGTPDAISKRLYGVRFHNKKGEYLVRARELFSHNGHIAIKSFLSRFRDIYSCRDWMVENIKGLGYKEASHFLRNIGFGEKIAILDRHILRNLKRLKVIEKIPESLSKAKYLDMEKKMGNLARNLHIPLSHLDLLLWFKETGEIFK
ncbi:MAG: N-glycosylase/DNA lyase [Nitrospirota bacterium]